MKTEKLTKLIAVTVLMGLQSAQALYTGASVGYMIDSEDEIFFAQVGTQIANKAFSHNLEFEVGYLEESEMGIEMEVIPLMLNYRLVNQTSDKLAIYFGVGAGCSLVDVSGYGVSDDENALTLQAMAGIECTVTESVALRLGYRYFYIDDVKLFDLEVGDLDDNIIEAGIVIRF